MSKQESQAIQNHYNELPELGITKRLESKILSMKNFNNWVKSILISRCVQQGDWVFDLCCGKGGDFLKWQKSNVKLVVAADIANVSIMQAQERFKNMRSAPPRTKFICADCCKVVLSDYIDKWIMFDIVSCQFSLHYSFQTETRARTLLRNASDRLLPGGHFIGTIPDAYWLVKKLRASSGTSFGNSVYKVIFHQKDHFPEFGCGYTFYLEDAVMNLKEYLVHFPTLERLANEFDLELEYKARFHDFYSENINNTDNIELLHRMKVLNEEGKISDDEWEAIGMYMVFIFKKKGQLQHTNKELQNFVEDFISIA